MEEGMVKFSTSSNNKLSVLKPTDPKLRKISRSVVRKEIRTKDFQDTIEELLDFVYASNNKGKNRDRKIPSTVGLSANQVGILKQISIVDLAIGKKRYSDIHVLINPQITKHSKVITEKSEGCVNLPEIWGVVPRFKWITVKALDRSGNEITIRAQGWAARLLQHEIDHLHGKLFIDKLPDPAKAHFVKHDGMIEYKKNWKTWDKFIDVTDLIK